MATLIIPKISWRRKYSKMIISRICSCLCHDRWKIPEIPLRKLFQSIGSGILLGRSYDWIGRGRVYQKPLLLRNFYRCVTWAEQWASRRVRIPDIKEKEMEKGIHFISAGRRPDSHRLLKKTRLSSSLFSLSNSDETGDYGSYRIFTSLEKGPYVRLRHT